MKKITTIVMATVMLFALSACGSLGTTEKSTTISSSSASEITQGTAQNESGTTSEEATSQQTTDVTPSADSSSTLVVYFSCTGNTKSIAEFIANGTSADIFEIIPEEPYTDADLDYNDNNSRSTKEMNDSSARPAISGTVENFDQYDTIYIGYPIWWGEAPRILDTFVESYDFTGKTVIPFCTSASSGIGSSANTLESLAGAGTWKSGQRFKGNESETDVMEWVNGQ